MDNSLFKIRKMATDDIPFVALIEKECFSSPWSEEGLKNELSNPSAEFYVLESEGHICAYMGMHIVLDECYIANVAVKNSCRRRGYGIALVKNALTAARKKSCSFISLEVRVSNKNAVTLYEKCGFERIGERKNFYSSPKENALIMTKYF